MKNITKRLIAAALSAATMLSSMAIVPTAGAADEDNKASAYTVILRRKLAKRLVGRDIAIETGGEAQHHVVEAFGGSDYAFGVQI